MRSNYKIAMVLLAGVAIGAVAVQSLHAQGAKLKAYAIAEFEPLDASAQASVLPVARKAIEAANGHSLRTTGGRVVQIEGGPTPRVWGSPNGVAWMRPWHSTSRKPGRTLHPNVTSSPR